MVGIITATGGRPQQLKLCKEWMLRQTYKGKVLWVIVDDCIPSTGKIISPLFRSNWIIIHKQVTPVWQSGQNTQKRNLQIGVETMKLFNGVKQVFIVEDDDYYSPGYISIMLELLKEFDLVGECNTWYYNVCTQEYQRMRNSGHASLFQTAFNINVLPEFEKVLQTKDKFIDINLWRTTDVNKYLLNTEIPWSVGVKGMPGRTGIGIGHRTTLRNKDINCETASRLLQEGFKDYKKLGYFKRCK